VNVEAARAELGVLDNAAFLNTGTFGPLPRRTLEAMSAGDRLDFERGRTGAWYPTEILDLRQRVREAVAGLIGVPPQTVALTRSTTEGCTIVCAGLRLSPGDEVVTTDVEHFGLLGPLAATGAHVRVARLRGRPPEDAFGAIAELVTAATRLIAVSHVAWTTGSILPVAELATIGPPVLVDGAQSVGAIRVAAAETGAAFYSFSGQKWLLGPGGTGALYVTPEWIDRLHVAAPSYYAQVGYDGTGAFTPQDGAARFDCGWQNRSALDGVLASLSFLADAGEERFAIARRQAERCRELLDTIVDLVTPPGHATLVTWASRDAAVESQRLAREA
jgi:L-cysteine/cystine lyase